MSSFLPLLKGLGGVGREREGESDASKTKLTSLALRSCVSGRAFTGMLAVPIKFKEGGESTRVSVGDEVEVVKTGKHFYIKGY